MSDFNVTNITVGYDRKRQPAQYESAGASVSFSAAVETGGDHVAVARKLLGEAKTLVLTELGVVKAGESASVHERAPAAPETPPADGPKAPATRTRKAKDDAPAVPAKPSDIPDDATPPAAPATPPAAPAKVAANDIPDSGPKTPAAPKPSGITATEMQNFIAAEIKGQRLLPATVRDLMASDTFKVTRLGELTEPKLVEFKAALDAKIVAGGHKPGG